MSRTTLYWHDYETSGIDPRRDRPVQFAGLRTDLDLHPIGEPLTLYCRPSLDTLPTPEASLVTGITPQQAWEKGVCEADFVAAIHGELARPGTCALGYNTLRFDDEVTRNTLYRNFYDPYEREWRSGNSRWDLIDAVRAAAALRPEGIEWPRDEQGRPSFRLEVLTAANGIAHAGAHDALVDVRATVELARLLRQRQPRLYDFLWSNRGKREAAALIKLGEFAPVLHVSEKFPAERHCLAVVVALARHPDNGNGVIVYDLSADPAPLLELDVEQIRARLFTPVRDMPEGVERIPLKTVHLNRCPVLAPMNVLRPADIERLQLDLERCRRHLETLRRASGLDGKLAEVFSAAPPEKPDDGDPDLMIYRGGFFGDADRYRMSEIRALGPEDLARRYFDFDDARLPEMLFRYRARNWPDTLSEEERARWETLRRTRLTEAGHGASITLTEYENRIEALGREHADDSRKLAVLEALRAWGREIIS
ncbi:exodeoxyribonuclease I [Methylococcus sp. EFPC2]|uniref:exodeoxyribonuclease I n=1 Tax=Methylococcus sp. EFPC2 TaxID=2812648 RepID=UPI0019682D77|nr:exodeoxyribonuclease I [Methylococcus sp. EFPC2]QSA95896.1 exodeoxyribonuclease I [Methylococcus sp. EFPC2]